MRFLACLILLFSLQNISMANEKLDAMLGERIKVNAQHRDEFAKAAEESPLAAALVPLEKKTGQAWVDYLTYVKSLDDDQLKIHVLRLEFYAELGDCLYDLEVAQGQQEVDDIKQELKGWKEKMDELDKVVAELKGVGEDKVMSEDKKEAAPVPAGS